METVLTVPQGTFKIQRLPLRKNEKLRAWDAADEYLLQYLSENIDLSLSSKILVVNDSFGALAVALHVYKPIAISDSFLSQQATRGNLLANELSEDCVQLNSSLDWPIQKVDLVLIKVPKTLALLEDQLIRLQPLLTAETKVIAAGMVKAMSSSVWKLMERYLGATKPSLAQKKARLIFIHLNPQRVLPENPYPVYYQLENTDYRICNHANVFSRDSLDIGTRFLLQHLPKNSDARNIVDLGCGNGVVGLMLAQYHSAAHLYFIDESHMAVASAKENFYHAFAQRQADFCIADGLTDFESESIDLIVCNPPFHQQHTVSNQLALSMFKQSLRVLRKGGMLRVIGNRHLAYHIDLKNLYGNCSEIAANSKFVIWQVIKVA
ncbi:MAG: methyltransferase [Methylococcaceae bacterium]|nr:methyltransferase [Methylococcaceae bacterium]